MTTDIRNKEIKIKVRDNESSLDAIKRYMEKKGFTYFESCQRGNYTHRAWYNEEYSDLWVGPSSYNEVTKIETFTLEGDK